MILLGTWRCAIIVPIGEIPNQKVSCEADLKGVFAWKSVALPGPRSIDKIKWGVPAVVIL
jgi:hypothetical protein